MRKAGNRELIIGGNLNKAIITIAIPLMLNGLIYALYNFIDSIFVANIGSVELATVALVGPLFNVIAAVSAGITISGTTLIGKNVGRGFYHKVEEYVLHLLLISLVLGLGILIIGLNHSDELLKIASATDNIIETGRSYFKLLMLSIPFTFLNAIYIAYKSGYGDTKQVMRVHLLSMALKIVFNYTVIIILDKGLNYLAIASLIGHISISFVALLELIQSKVKIMKVFKNFKLNVDLLKKIVYVSIPVIIEKSSMSFSFVMINGNVLKYGETVLAAYGITNRINSVFFSAINGLGSGIATITSQNIGARQNKRVKKTFTSGLKLGLVMSIIFAMCLLVFKASFASLFSKDDLVLYNHVINAISVYSISIIPWTCFQIVIGMFTGAGKTKYNLVITMARLYVFRLPSIIILSKIISLNEYSVWIAMLVSNIITALFALTLYFMKRHKVYTDD